MRIAEGSGAVHNITVARYADDFAGKRYRVCYHCERRAREQGRPGPPLPYPWHAKSGGCWTAYAAEKLVKSAHWYVVPNEEAQ